MDKGQDTIEKAARLAARAHRGQTRKESDLPYVVHPFMVAIKLIKYGFSDTVIAAALVHDVLEDASVTTEELSDELGNEVAQLVTTITNDDSLPWLEKKKKYIESVRIGPVEAKAIATADKVHNLESLLIAYETDGNKVWAYFNSGMKDKIWFEEAMLKMLQESWQHPLIKEYESLLSDLKERIKKSQV